MTVMPKIYLSSTILSGGGYFFTPETALDFMYTGLTTGWAIGADFNLDGTIDVLVGSPGSDDKDVDAGRVYLNYDHTSENIASGLDTIIIDGATAGDMAGASLGLVDSVNGDVYSDFIIGAPGLDLSAPDAGGAYVLFNKQASTVKDLGNLDNGDGGGYVITGEAAGDRAGEAVAGIHDLNGDGKGDVIVGAAGNDQGGVDAGAVYVTWGRNASSALSLTNVAGGSGGYKIYGENSGDAAGKAVTTIADLNGDGKDEIVVGATGNDGGASNGGAVYVVYGKSTGAAVNLDDVAAGTGGYKIVGSTANLGLGTSVATIGDLNDDGKTDLLLGAAGGNKAYVVFGKADTAAVTTAGLEAGVGGFAIVGEPGHSLAGLTVAGGVDLNEDGIEDYVIGAPYDSEGGANAGAVYVIWGGSLGTVNLSSIAAGVGGTKIVGSAGSMTGSSVSIIPDANGDGKPDLLIGSSGIGGERVSVLYSPSNWQPGPEVYGTAGDDLITAGYGNPHHVGDAVDNIFGYGGNDTILSAGGDDTVDGGAGNDSIDAGLGNDSVIGGLGDDTIIGGDGNNRLFGNEGIDSITSGSGADYVDGGAGNDVIDTGAGNDTIVATSGVDLVHAGAGADTITIGAEGGTVYGEGDNDTITGSTAGDFIDAGEGNNTVNAGAGDNTVSSGAGDDVVTSGAGNDLVNAGDGTNTVNAGDGNNSVTTGSGADVINTGTGDDVINAGDGLNQINAGDGLNHITTGAGDDVITSGIGADIINAGDGNNSISSGAGDDSVTGGIGNDTIDGGAGADTMVGGDGNDTYYVDDLHDVIVDTGGTDTVIISAALIDAGWVAPTGIETVSIVGTASVHLTGTAAADSLVAGNGNDTIDGGAGDDVEIGGEGNDVLISSAGHDSLIGGAGDDRFVVSGGSAHIEDFSGNDTIDASASTADDVIDLENGHTSTVDGQTIDLSTGGTTTQSLDVQFLQDVTGSFADDIANVRTLIPQIVSTLQAVQPDADFGVSTFRDKPLGSFGGVGDWVYDTLDKLSPDTAALTAAYASMVAYNGADEPEAQLEALMQLALRETEVGFRAGSARVVVLFTDAPFHNAGDGAPLGLTPNNGDAIVSPTEDYPMIAQVKSALEAAGIIPVFAVANGYDPVYQDLVTQLGRGQVVTLTANSSNIISAIQTGLTNATTTLIENAVGGAGNDTITGNVANNKLDGGAGNDVINGLAGDDTITGGIGSDHIDGGTGNDTAVYAGAQSQYTVVTDGATGITTITDKVNGDVDTVVNVETLSFSDGTVAVGASAGGGGTGGGSTVTISGTDLVALTEDGAAGTSDALAFAVSSTGAPLSAVVDPATLPAGVTFDATTHSFALDPTAAAFQHLAQGELASIVVAYQVTDGTSTAPTQIEFQVTGVNDAPVVSGDVTSSAFVGDTAFAVDALGTSSDPDTLDILTAVVDPATLPPGVTFDATTNSFVVDPSDPAYATLADGTTQTLTVSYSVTDGLVAQPVNAVITITGTYIAPVVPVLTVTGPVATAANEDAAVVTLDALANASDTSAAVTLAALVDPATLPAGVTFDATTNSFALDPSNAAFQSLAAGQTTIITVDYNVTDGTNTVATSAAFTVTGINDAAVISGTTYGLATEDLNTTVSGVLDVVDVDTGESSFVAGTVAGAFGSLTIDAAGVWSYVVDGTNALVDALGLGQSLTDTVTVASLDGTTQTIVVDILGMVDAPAGANVITGTAALERINGTDAAEAIYGLGGNDSIVAGGGNDFIDGGEGRDVVNAGAGDDTILVGGGTNGTGSLAGTPSDAVEGGTGYDTVVFAGRSTDYHIVSVAGTPMVQLDDLTSGRRYMVSNVERLSFADGTNIDLVADTGVVQAPAHNAAATEDGVSVSIDALAGAVSPYGDPLSVVFDPATLPAGVTYDAATHSFVLDPANAAFQALNAGQTATVIVDYTVTDGNRSTGTTATFTVAGVNDISVINGTSGNDNLVGTSGNDVIDGLAGKDTMAGGLGDDTYYVDNAKDVVTEGVGAGHDTVYASVSHTLAANVEDLVLTGTAANGTGNGLDNAITGNDVANSILAGAGNDTIHGGAGNDTIFGNDGNDVIDGGAGADVMSGGLGNDTFYVDNAGDVVSGGSGIDTVITTLNTYTLSPGSEVLIFAGVGDFIGTGNAGANTIIGGAGHDVLSGGIGNDLLDGGAGTDLFTGGAGNDRFVFHAGQAQGDTVTDFQNAGSKVGDVLVFEGFGAGHLSYTGTLGHYLVTADAAHGGATEEIVLTGINKLDLSLTSNDFQFI